MSIETRDVTGTLPSIQDVADARAAVRKMIVTMMLKLPPELAIQLPTIDRCLAVVEIVIRAETQKKETK